ncbi:conserved hypothetical protein [Shewanella sediminis HAW-EB3]|uniref:Uncharacterized protein n=1 Tax=Shewanella sediminis (strain HAW-EB3) TaxID=425104 RepID=A8FWX5_SHESH|nr:conserved hypothetical protein [Shewanella sediminis HAW-EB3]
MNLYFIAAAGMGLLACIGHFTYGVKHFLTPMLNAQFELVAKTVLHCFFHYLSVFLVLSTLVLASCGFEIVSKMQGLSLVLFVALNFGIFAIWQIYIAFVSDIKAPFKHLFQWALFLGIATLSLMGVYL